MTDKGERTTMEAEMEEYRIEPAGTGIKKGLAVIVLAAGFIGSFMGLGIDMGKFMERLSNVGPVLRRMAAINLTILPDIAAGIGISMALAVVSLLAGAVISVNLAFLAASNITPLPILAAAIKGIVAVIRAVPALVWVLMVAASIGFGNTGGMIGLMFPVIGYLTKSFIATIEEQGGGAIEAMRASGTRWIDIVLKGLLPESIPGFISWIAIRFESNIAESISFGMVGVSGIGMLLNRAIYQYKYSSITTIILVIFLSMFVIEILSNYITAKVRK